MIVQDRLCCSGLDAILSFQASVRLHFFKCMVNAVLLGFSKICE